MNDISIKVSRSIATVPNFITGIGILLTAFYIWQFSEEKYVSLIPITIGLIGISDVLDGFAARCLDQHSVLGKIIDPLCDRFLGIAILTNMFYVDSRSLFLPWFITIIFLFELLFYIKSYFSFTGIDSIQVHLSGKIRQMFHGICGGIFATQEYWNWHWHSPDIPAYALLFWMAFASASMVFLKEEKE